MSAEVKELCEDLVRSATGYGIAVRLGDLDEEVPGEFDGLTITLNKDYDAVERAFYLAHSIGSIAEWSLHPDRSNQIMNELRQAKKDRHSNRARFEGAITAYLAFEVRTWEFAVWLLENTRHESFLPAFINFGRADMEAMRVFHSKGKAPNWREFFSTWNQQVRQGMRTVIPLIGRCIPSFEAKKIPMQEIVQEEDDPEG